uniref:low molecular weight protein-tyrosine-phosphatase n=1 Tax=Acetatifactor sp. TaxID=1872090 RepID=UPI004055A4E1
MKDKIKVLMVCHGNICRSPMAEFILKDIIQKRGLAESFYIASAATSTEEIWNGVGNPVYPPAREELVKHGIDCSGKRAVQVTKADYEKYDYLICMDKNNLRNLSRIIGLDTEGKVSMLLDYAGREGQSIADPWYTGNFKVTYSDVVEGCEGLLRYLIENGQV